MGIGVAILADGLRHFICRVDIGEGADTYPIDIFSVHLRLLYRRAGDIIECQLCTQ